MDKKEIPSIFKFIPLEKKFGSSQRKDAVINLDETEPGTQIQDANNYRIIPDSSAVNQAFNLSFNTIQKELDRLNIKIDRDIDRLNIKIDRDIDKLENNTDSEVKKLVNRIDSLVKLNTICIITGVSILAGLIFCYFSYLSK